MNITDERLQEIEQQGADEAELVKLYRSAQKAHKASVVWGGFDGIKQEAKIEFDPFALDDLIGKSIVLLPVVE